MAYSLDRLMILIIIHLLIILQVLFLNNIIHLEKVNKLYGTQPSGVHALVDIDLNFNSGDFIGILGKSGAGKSTLVNILAGIDRVTSGEVRIQGKNISDLDEEELALWRGKNVGVVYQTFQLLNQLTILDNMLLAMDFCGKPVVDANAKRALAILTSLEIEDQAYKRPPQLSGGQKQRAAIARALANDPPIILADEPTGNLDSKTSATILNVFSDLARQDRTVIVVTHDNSKENIFSKVINLKDGKIINAKK
jgi:putative ABC transport system ATP-binding protein